MKLFILSILVAALFIVHEWGHYLAYRVFYIPAYFKKSLFVPQVLPKETVTVSKLQGLIIALAGFIVSTILIVLPCIFIYPLWRALLVGSLAGSSVDFIWALSICFTKKVIIQSKYDC